MRALRHIRFAVNDAYEGIRRLRQQLRDAEDTIRRQVREIDMLITSLRQLKQGHEPVSETNSDAEDEAINHPNYADLVASKHAGVYASYSLACLHSKSEDAGMTLTASGR
ncbi:hypothetical protein PF006_g23637 [Phytophthora fragariae]|uniref:Uncharacterized protein n=1 Tax=Phytophthora fragariae TaxID=53985 RepID=A0A6A3RHT9_9STRA|nr:hypothetical protein PF006_g23637 [Phytophthora fragariae]